MASRQAQHGFTLVELLLVIAVVSIMTAIGISTYRRHFQSTRAEKVSLEIQQVLEAAMAYHTDQGQWPAQRICQAPLDETDTFVTDYLPNAQLQSALGTAYCWQAVGSGESTEKPLFAVLLQVPGDHTMAQRIAARLPNAIVVASPDERSPTECVQSCFVRTEISVPGVGQGQQGAIIAAAGNCEHGQTIASSTGECVDVSPSGRQQYRIQFPACPSSTEPQLIINANFLKIPTSKLGIPMTAISARQLSCTPDADSEGKASCLGEVIVDICQAKAGHNCREVNVAARGGYVGASYLVTCTKKNQYE